MKDPYDVLGVPKTAAPDEIKKAYRKLARTLHPDINPGNKQAESRFKEVTAAYDLLSDPDKKARYDRGEIDPSGAERPRYSSWRTYADGAGGTKYSSEDAHFGVDVDDILADLFGGGRRGRKSGPRKGADTQYSLRVPFVEAAVGTTKRVTMPNGKSLDVRIPPGTTDGQTMRLKGQGEPGAAGAPAGDAYVEIKVDPDPLYTRDGNDVRVEVPVTLQEAVLGGKITVPTVHGKVSVTVPANSNTGSVLRLKGKGIAGGDQFVTLKVMLPDRADEALANFLRSWKTSYDPRAKVGMG